MSNTLLSLMVSLVVLSYYDIRHYSIPTIVIVAAYWVIFMISDVKITAISNMLLSSLPPYFFNRIYQYLRQKTGLGLGDSLTIGLIGGASHPLIAMQTLTVASWIACLHWLKQDRKPRKIPFIPYLTLATIIVEAYHANAHMTMLT